MGNYWSNKDISDKYNVAPATVARWIKLAISQKNNLKIDKFGKKYKILKNDHNQAEILRLKNKGLKHLNKLVIKEFDAPKEFLNTYSKKDIYDIVNEIENDNSIAIKYTYTDEGGNQWDEFYKQGVSIVNKNVKELIAVEKNKILYFLPKNRKINIIDLGCGNGYPLKNFIKELSKTNVINKYIGIDISQSVLDICLENMKNWFPDIKSEGVIKDFEDDELISTLSEAKDDPDQINLIFHIGNTLSNHDNRPSVLINIRKSMQKDDLFIASFSNENEEAKVEIKYVQNPVSDNQHTSVLRKLGVDIEKCTIKSEYSSKINAKVKKVKLDKQYIINFPTIDGVKKLELFSGQEICIWKHYLLSVENFSKEAKQSGLSVISLTLDNPQLNVLSILKKHKKISYID